MGGGKYVWLPLGALVSHTIARDQSLRDDLRTPDDATRSGLKEVLLAHVGLQTEGIILLSSVLRTWSCVDHL